MDNFEDEKLKKKNELIQKLAAVTNVTFLEGIFVYISMVVFMVVFLGDIQMDWFISIIWAYMITTFVMTFVNYDELEKRINSVRKDK